MKVRELMTANVQNVHPGVTLREAARRMAMTDVGSLPVYEQGILVGMVTDRDLVVNAVADGADADGEIVASVMSLPAAWCYEDADVEEAARIMRERQVRRLVVLDRRKNLAGIVSIGDIARGERNDEMIGELIEDVSQPGEEHPPAKAA